MSNLLNTVGKIITSVAKGYGKQTAKKRDKEDAKGADNTKAAADKEQKTQKSSE